METLEPNFTENQPIPPLALLPSDPALYEKSRKGVVVVSI